MSLSRGINLVIIGYVAQGPRRPHPTQQSDELLIVLEAPGRLCELAYGEVRLLLAGARLTEGYASNLYHCRAQAGNIRPTAHLTLLLFASCLDQEVLVSSVRVCCCLLAFNNCKKSL